MREQSERLRQVIATAEPRLRGITDEAAALPKLKGGWSSKQLIGHLIDSASNNHQRFVRASLQDSYEGPGYGSNDWVDLQDYQGQKWSELIALWAAYNRHLAHLIARLPEAKAKMPCKIGKNEYKFEWVVTDYVDHMVGHLKQIGGLE
jgi:hypothetical protein